MRQVEVPDPVRRKAHVEGPECVRWLDDLGDLISELEREWDIAVGETMTGGTASVVAAANAGRRIAGGGQAGDAVRARRP